MVTICTYNYIYVPYISCVLDLPMQNVIWHGYVGLPKGNVTNSENIWNDDPEKTQNAVHKHLREVHPQLAINHSQHWSPKVLVSDDHNGEPRSITRVGLKYWKKKNIKLNVEWSLSYSLMATNPISSDIELGQIGWFSVPTDSEASSRSLVQRTGKRASFSCGTSTDCPSYGWWEVSMSMSHSVHVRRIASGND